MSEISQAIFPYRQLLVGFSGGLDSTVLLHRLKSLQEKESTIKLRAVHIHHNLSSEADNWVRHCISQCNKWKIPLVIVHASVIQKKSGIEAQARKERYLAFRNVLLPGEVLVIAHHLDDQCETFFLALKRGSGPTGLSSMPKQMRFFDTKLIRPLLYETRESLEKWAKVHSLKWVEDESNHNSYYDRNFFRLNIIPLLSKRWSHIRYAISRSAELCAEQENLLDELLDNELTTLISPEGALKIEPLEEVSVPRRNAILRRWFAKQRALMPSRLILNLIWKEVAQARKNSESPCIHLNGYNICRFNGLLWREKKQVSFDDMIIQWPNTSLPLLLPNNMGRVFLKSGGNIPAPSKGEKVTVRFQSKGRVNVLGRQDNLKLKKIWKELNIPPWRSSRVPLLFYDTTLIAVIGKCISKIKNIKRGMHFKQEF